MRVSSPDKSKAGHNVISGRQMNGDGKSIKFNLFVLGCILILVGLIGTSFSNDANPQEDEGLLRSKKHGSKHHYRIPTDGNLDKVVSAIETSHAKLERKLREKISRLEEEKAAAEAAAKEAAATNQRRLSGVRAKMPDGFPPTVVTVATTPRADLMGAFTNPTLLLMAIAHKYNWAFEILPVEGSAGEEQIKDQFAQGHEIDKSWGSGFIDANHREGYDPVENNRQVHEVLGFFPKKSKDFNSTKWIEIEDILPPGEELEQLCHKKSYLENGILRCRMWFPKQWFEKTRLHDHDIIQRHIVENGGFDSFFTESFREKLYTRFMKKNKHRVTHFSDDTYDVAIHVRRGDEMKSVHPDRWIDQDVYANIARRICKKHPEAIIHVFSAGVNRDGNWDEMNAVKDYCGKIVYHLDEVEFDTWAHFVAADEFVMSKSTFSYVPALFSMAKIHYPSDYWFGRLSHWVDYSSATGKVIKKKKAEVKQES